MELLRITRQIHCKAVEQRATLIHRQYNRDWGTSYSRPPIDLYLTSPLLQNPGGATATHASSAGTIFSLGGKTRRVYGWVESIRQVDVDLNFLVVECSSVDWIYAGNIFWVGRIHWLPTQCYSWVGDCPPCRLGSRATDSRYDKPGDRFSKTLMNILRKSQENDRTYEDLI